MMVQALGRNVTSVTNHLTKKIGAQQNMHGCTYYVHEISSQEQKVAL